MIGPDESAIARLTVAPSSPRDVSIAAYSAIRGTPTEFDKAATWPWRIQSQPEAPPHSDACGGRKGGINDMAREPGVRLGLRAWPHRCGPRGGEHHIAGPLYDETEVNRGRGC